MWHSVKRASVPTFWSALQPSKSTFVHIYKLHLRWSVKTLEIFSLYFCQLNNS